MKVAETRYEVPARHCVRSCGQEPARYYINERRSHFEEGSQARKEIEAWACI
jgi:hypothetical protein